MKKIILLIPLFFVQFIFGQINFNFSIPTNTGILSQSVSSTGSPWYGVLTFDLTPYGVCEGDTIMLNNNSNGSIQGSSITGNTIWDLAWGYLSTSNGNQSSWFIQNVILGNQTWTNPLSVTIPISTSNTSIVTHTLIVSPDLGNNFFGLHQTTLACSSGLEIKIKVKKAPQCLNNLQICEDETINDQLLGIPSGVTATNWSPNDPRINTPINGLYNVTISNGSCTRNCSFNINLINPVFELINDQIICSNDLPYLSQNVFDVYATSITINGVIVFQNSSIINSAYFDQTQNFLMFTNPGNYLVEFIYYDPLTGNTIDCPKTYNLNISSPTIHLPSIIYHCNLNDELEICGPNAPSYTNYSYQWWGPSTNTQTSVLLGSSNCFVPIQYGSYTLIVTDQNGCSNSVTHNFTVSNQLPLVDLGEDIIICEGDFSSLAPISIANQGFENSNATITWYDQDGNIIQNGGTVLQIMPTSGKIIVTVSVPGCHFQSDEIEITTKKCCPQEVNIGIILCPGQEPIFHILNQGYDTDDYNISWYYNDSLIQSGGEVLEMSIYGNGEITVVVSKEGCRKISDSLNISCDKDVNFPFKKESVNQFNITISPNPTTDIVNFSFDKNETGKIEIYSLEGKLVFSKEFKEINQLETSMSAYQDGVYIARITTNDTTITKKIIKE